MTHENAGVRLKGNSSLFELTQETAQNPEDLPWLIRLDKYVDDQNHQGYNDIVIRSTSTETALNEAVALELLDATGLAAEQAIATTSPSTAARPNCGWPSNIRTTNGKTPTSIASTAAV